MATDFAQAVRDHYTSDKKIIDFYSTLYQKMLEMKLLDSNFVSQMSDHEKTIHRLSELVILEHCTCCVKDIVSENKGPDLAFEFEGRRVNIEITTPVKVELRKSKLVSYVFPSPKGQSTKGGKVDVNVPVIDALHERIAGVFKAKAEKYQDYLAKNTISDEDINIVCINVGFIEGNEFIDYSYLKNIFTRKAAIHLEIDQNSEVSAGVIDYSFHVAKKNKTILKTSYFENAEFDHVDGVWLISCNEKNLKAISKKQHSNYLENNLMYHNLKSMIHPALLFALKINSPQQEEGFLSEIRNNKKLPEA